MKTYLRRILQKFDSVVSTLCDRPTSIRGHKSRFISRLAVEALEFRHLLAATLYVDNPGDFVITNDVSPLGPTPTAGDTVTWNPGPGSQHGGAVTNLTFGATAFGSIQDAVNFASAGDTIRVGPGTFAEAVN